MVNDYIKRVTIASITVKYDKHSLDAVLPFSNSRFTFNCLNRLFNHILIQILILYYDKYFNVVLLMTLAYLSLNRHRIVSVVT